jgi:hypothetical protein
VAGGQQQDVGQAAKFVDGQRDQAGRRRSGVAFGGGGHCEKGNARARWQGQDQRCAVVALAITAGGTKKPAARWQGADASLRARGLSS